MPAGWQECKSYGWLAGLPNEGMNKRDQPGPTGEAWPQQDNAGLTAGVQGMQGGQARAGGGRGGSGAGRGSQDRQGKAGIL